jgi:gliding motility-associated-like protein
MRLWKYIVSTGLLMAVWIAPVLSQDYLAVVCAGDTGVAYYVKGAETSTFNWTVEGGAIVEDHGDSIIVDWFVEPGAYGITVQEVSEHQCAGTISRGTVLVSAPEVELGEDVYICDGDIFTIEPEGEYNSYTWSDGTTGASFTTTEQGLITLTVTDSYGCAAEDDLMLEVRPLPYVDLGRDTSLCGEQYLVLDAGTDAVSYRWSTGDIGSQIMVYQGYQEISVQVEDAFGCENADSIVINDCNVNIYFEDIPNTITPSDQDGRNDVWRIEKLEAYPDAVVDIYDRWGRLIWRSAPGYPTPWDGRNMRGNDVPMDSYHYVILLNFGGDDRVTGAVTVIR